MSDTVPSTTIVKKKPKGKYIIVGYHRTGRIPLPASDIRSAKIMKKRLKERSSESMIYRIKRMR